MTAHDRAVEAARSTLGKALPLLPIALDGLARLVVEAVEPIIRADEREGVRIIRRATHADLRAEVLGLPERADAHDDDCPGRPGYRGICTCDGDILVSRAAVLALLDEAQP